MVALVALVIGGIAAKALGRVVLAAGTRAGMARPDMLARVASGAVWAFAAVVAIHQLGIASTLMNILLMAIMGAVALALGLSFGLGGRDTASLIVRLFYERNRQRSGQIVGAANEARRALYAGDQRHAMVDRRSPHGRRAS